MKLNREKVCRSAAAFLIALMAWIGAAEVQAQSTTVEIAIKNHRFQPAEIRAPAGTPITIRIRNLDSTPMEFESVTLRVEKVVAGNSEGVINVRALSPGRYNFFDDFNQQAKGVLVVQ